MPYGKRGRVGGGNGNSPSSIQSSKPVYEATKSISHGAVSNQIYSLSDTVSASAPSGTLPREIEITNTGGTPVTILAGYETYSDETTETNATRYLHTMLMPNEVWYPSVRAVISTENASTQFDGTPLDNEAPNSNMYTEFSDGVADIDSATAAGIVGHATNTTVYLEPYTSAANCSANLFRVGDLIRVRNEVMEVTAIGDKSNLANNYLTVKRDMYGTDGGTSAVDNDSTRLPFFNAYHDFDQYSVSQTDSLGRFKCFNMFGQGRAATGKQGIIPGSFSVKFYEAGYQELGLSGITGSTNSGLTASTNYAFDIQVDGGTNFDNLTFTTDSSNVNFGGTNGIISKIQSALDTQFYTSGNLFEKKVTVGIVGGDIRFTSGSHLSTSAIAITAEDGADASFLGTGRIPAVGNIDAAVAAKLPDDVIYDRVTYDTSSNSSVFGYDDGSGNLSGMCSGTINYETGAIDMTGCPPNAEFVYSVAHTSAFSGKLVTAANALVEILANTPSQKWSGQVMVRTFR